MKKIVAKPEALSECIKPWTWVLSDQACPVPEQVNPIWFHCRSCSARDSLARYEYKGQPLFVCRNCGEVYELAPHHGKYKYDLKIWSALWKQPFYWKCIDNCPGMLASDLIHCSGAIKTHPFIEAHYKDDPSEAAEMIVRHLIFVRDMLNLSFFFENTDEKYVSFDGEEIEKYISSSKEELIITDGKTDAAFPKDEFCILREDRDHLTFECNVIENSNVFGFTADVNMEDWESTAYYTSLKITFLSENKDELPSDTEVLDLIPATEGIYCKRRWIIKKPFGLEGYYLFELNKDSYDFGYLYEGH